MIKRISYIRISAILLIIGMHTAMIAQNAYTVCDTSASMEKLLGEKLLAKVFVNPMVSNNNQFFNYWSKGDVELTNGSVVKNELIRYNSYIDELIWLRGTDYNRGIVYKTTVKSFKFLNEKNVPNAFFKKLKIKNWYTLDSVDTYLQVLEEGKLCLYVQRRVININKSTKELVQKDLYFLKRNGIYYNFKPNRWTLYNVMKEGKENMKTIVRKFHLRVKREEDLITAIKNYNIEFGK